MPLDILVSSLNFPCVRRQHQDAVQTRQGEHVWYCIETFRLYKSFMKAYIVLEIDRQHFNWMSQTCMVIYQKASTSGSLKWGSTPSKPYNVLHERWLHILTRVTVPYKTKNNESMLALTAKSPSGGRPSTKWSFRLERTKTTTFIRHFKPVPRNN